MASPVLSEDVETVDVAHSRARRHPWQWVASVVAVLFGAWVVMTGITSPELDWAIIAKYLTFRSILVGLWTTIWLTVVAMLLGIIGGVALAVARTSKNIPIRAIAEAYVWFFRGTPLLVQLIFWYNIALFLPTMSIGVPFGPALWQAPTNNIITPIIAAVLGLSLNEAAYMCEVVRGGVLSVGKGQTEAAQALGLSSWNAFTRIILPQAMRAIVPPTGNQVIGMLKGTSLVSVIAVSELLYSAQTIYNTNAEVIPLLMVVSIWYLIVTSVLYVFQAAIERHYGRGAARTDSRKRKMWKTSPVTLSVPEEAR